MNLSQFNPFKQYSFYDDSIDEPNIRERNPVAKRDPTVYVWYTYLSWMETVLRLPGKIINPFH
jgi:hypothetical protein